MSAGLRRLPAPGAATRPVFRDGVAPDWRRHCFDWQAGRPAFLLLAHEVAPAAAQPLLAAFAAAVASSCHAGIDILLISAPPLLAALHALAPPGSRIEAVPCDPDFLAASGTVPGELRVVLVDRNMRVVGIWPMDRARPDLLQSCLHAVSAIPQATPAPVLLLPNVLPPALCRQLIAFFECSESVEGEIAGQDHDGRPRNYVDHAVKRRRDVQLLPQDPLAILLASMLLERCAPEIEKAFAARVFRTDRLLLARYDAPDGKFRRHRDNASAKTAFRTFAVSVNLDAAAHEGGGLVFPEYCDTPVLAPTGGALVFSASLLHEVLPVTRGRRHALLSFFCDAAAGRRCAPAAAEA